MKPPIQNNVIKAKKEVREFFNEVRELFNEIRSNIICEDRKEIRKNLYKKETIYIFLKEKVQEGSV